MWSWQTFFFYLFMSIIGMLLIKRGIKTERNKYFIIWFIIWIIWACFRYVGYYNGFLVGGGDALTYVTYFDSCLSENSHLYATHAELGFRVFTKIIRSITSNYHIYFFVIYGIILLSIKEFLEAFSIRDMNCVPFIMLGFIYVKSFSVIRSALSIALILFGICLLKKEKNIACVVLVALSVMIQRASIVYAGFPIFYYVYQRKRLTKKSAVVFVLISIAFGVVIQKVLSGGSWAFFSGGAYDKYVVMSLSPGYWIDYFKLVGDQILVLIIIVFMKNKLDKQYKTGQLELPRRLMKDAKSITMLECMCYYELLLAPFCGILDIWRGADYFYVPRLVLLGVLIKRVADYNLPSFYSRRIFRVLVYGGIIFWFSLRMYTIYDKSDIMPYIFSLSGGLN